MNTEQLEKTVYRIKPEIVILDSDELREATLRLTELTEGIATLTASLDSDAETALPRAGRPTILGRLSRIENKIARLLQGGDNNND